jgi:WD domain, G-beta repeat
LSGLFDDLVAVLGQTATGKSDAVVNLSFSPDGANLAMAIQGGENRMVRVCDMATGKEIRQLRGDYPEAMAISPDGKTMAWGGQHRVELSLVEVATGQLRRKFIGHVGHISCVAFSPNSRMVASGSPDGTVLIWDVTGQSDRQNPPTLLNAAQLEKLWGDLALEKDPAAYQAVCTLRAAPRSCVELFEKHMKPVPRAEAKRVAAALRDLDSPEFTVRNEATKELEKLGEAAGPALRQVLAENPSLEMQRRAKQLLDRFEGSHKLRIGRALEILEQIGDSESRLLLTAIAKGAPEAGLTRDAQAALDRMDR